MKLTPADVEKFKPESLDKTWFLDYLRRLKVDLFSPETLTKENLDAKKQAVQIIEDEIEKRIIFAGQDKAAETNKEYL